MKAKRKLSLLLILTLIVCCAAPASAASATCPSNPYGTSHIWNLYPPECENSTCQYAGQAAFVCEYCGEFMYEPYDKLPHPWGDWHVVREATCYSEGLMERQCTFCGIYDESTIPRKEHTWGQWTNTRAATCALEGTESRVCAVCGDIETRLIPTIPHRFSDWAVVREMTDHSTGLRERSCSVCGTRESEEFYPEGTLRVGSRGNEVTALQQSLIDLGYLTPGSADGIYGNGTAAAVRQFQEASGLSGDGIAWPQTIQMASHVFGPWEVETEVTQFEPGVRRRTCTDCGYEQRQTVYPAGILRSGDRGEGVLQLQSGLNANGYDCGSPDGAFGPMTEAAVRAMERDYGYQEDGLAWPGMQLLMNESLPQLSGYYIELTVNITDGEKDSYMAGDVISFETQLVNHGTNDLYNWQIVATGDNDPNGIIYKPEGQGERLAVEQVVYGEPSTYTITEEDVEEEYVYVSWIGRAELPDGSVLMTDPAGFSFATTDLSAPEGPEEEPEEGTEDGITPRDDADEPWPDENEPAAEPEPTETPTPEPTATSTPTPEPTATSTPTPEPTATSTPTPEPTATSTPTPEPTATNTPTPEPTATSTPTPEPTAAATPTQAPAETGTPAPTPATQSLLSSGSPFAAGIIGLAALATFTAAFIR